MMRILLFLATNVAVLALISIVFNLLGLQGLLDANGVDLNLPAVLIFAGIAGFDSAFIGETICDSADREPLPFVKIDPPTIEMQICVNDGPLAGRDGKYVTSRQIYTRLVKETRTNVSLEISGSDSANIFTVAARGESSR